MKRDHLRSSQDVVSEIAIDTLLRIAHGEVEGIDDAPLSDLLSRGYVTRHQVVGDPYFVVTNAGWELIYYKY